MRLWDFQTGEQLWADHSLRNWIFAVAFTPDSRYVWACSRNEAKCFDCSTHATTQTLDIFDIYKGGSSGWPSVAFAPDCSRLVIANYGTLEVHNLANMMRIFKIDKTWISGALIDQEGRILCGGDENRGQVDQRNGATGEVIRSFYGSRRTIALALSKDEKYLAAATAPADSNQSPSENRIRIWRYTGGVVQKLSVPDGWQYTLAFSPDSRFLVSGGSGRDTDWHARKGDADRSIRVWEIETGREVRRLQGHEAAVRCVAFSPDGHLLVSGSADSTLRVWQFEE